MQHNELRESRRAGLVTGATGFIGSHLGARSCSRNPGLRGACAGARPASCRPARSRVSSCSRATCCGRRASTGSERDVDHVVHCAGILGKWGTPDTEMLHEVNVQGALNVLCWSASRTAGSSASCT